VYNKYIIIFVCGAIIFLLPTNNRLLCSKKIYKHNVANIKINALRSC